MSIGISFFLLHNSHVKQARDIVLHLFHKLRNQDSRRKKKLLNSYTCSVMNKRSQIPSQTLYSFLCRTMSLSESLKTTLDADPVECLSLIDNTFLFLFQVKNFMNFIASFQVKSKVNVYTQEISALRRRLFVPDTELVLQWVRWARQSPCLSVFY